MSDEVAQVMICCRTEKQRNPVAGSVTTHCSKCGCELWIAGDMLFAYPQAKHVCLPCEMPSLKAAIADGTVETCQAEAPMVLELIKRGMIDPEQY